MKLTRHYKSFNYKSLFSNLSILKSFEGGTMYYGEKDGKYYTISDESLLSEFIEDEIDSITIREFTSKNELHLFFQERGIKNETSYL